MLNHTTSRIFDSENIVLTIIPIESVNFTLVYKWGFDCSTGNSEYKQPTVDSSLDDDSPLFAISKNEESYLLKKTI